MFDFNLTQTEQIANLLQVGAVDNCLMNQVTFLFLCLLSQNVTVVSVMSFNLTCSSETESLLRTGVSFNFWHFF